jgi:tryptophan-rich sensory protein
MGISLAKLIGERRSDPRAGRAIQLFALQLMLNGLWTLIFFRWKSPGWALVEIVVLLAAIAMTIRAAWRVSPLAGALLVPYLLWVAFATVLNGSIWWMNRGQ